MTTSPSHRWFAPLAVVCACTFDTGGLAYDRTYDSGPAPDLPPPPPDLGPDLGPDGPVCDPEVNPCCGLDDDDRACVGDAPARCTTEGEPVIERTCPAPSTCAQNPPQAARTAAYCEVSACRSCSTPRDCADGEVCAPFFRGNQFTNCCVARAAGRGGAYAPCAQGDDCDTGVCVANPEDMGGQCFYACPEGAEGACPPEPGAACVVRPVYVDGVVKDAPTCARQ